jgi:hypothetical protein
MFMNQSSPKTEAPKILRSVSLDHGFHFYTEKGNTGITAISLSDFATKLETIDVNSVIFHYPRGDFQKWIDDTLGDKDLANRMCFIQTSLTGDYLRKHLLMIIQKRITNLKEQQSTKHTDGTV